MKILGIGNALVDVLGRLSDDMLLEQLNLPKGSMNLIDIETRNNLFKKIKNKNTVLTTGGSAGNTCLALGHLGVTTGFIGKLGDDDYASLFANEYQKVGIESHFIYESNPSGTAIVLISPDGERTFGTYLGVAAEMNASELQEAIFKQYTHLYIEGYLVQNHDLIETALSIAKSLGLKTALDLASYNIVEEEKEFLQHLIKEYVDIVFANESEALVLTGKNPKEAVKELGSQVEIAIVKAGGDGSWAMRGNQLEHIEVETIVPVDSTAAGDYYAAGFFYGLTHDASLRQCIELGSLLAGEIIKVVGTQLSESVWNDISHQAKLIVSCK